jgi:hypothetical protein
MKRPYIILIVVLLIALFVLLLERPGEFDVGDFKAFKLYSDLKLDKVSKIRIEHLMSGSLLERTDDDWKVSEIKTNISKQLDDDGGAESSLKFNADREKVDGIIERVRLSEAISLASTNPEKRSTYQVDKLGKRVRFYDDSDKILVDLYIGKNGPDMFSTYVRRSGEDDVYMVGEHIGAAIPADVMNWRNKEIWNLEPGEISGIKVNRAGEGESFFISRDEDGAWHSASSNDKVLDQKKVEKFIENIAQINAIRFASIAAGGETGLDSPALEVELTTNDGKKYKLLVGKADMQGYIYAKLAGRDEETYLLSSNFDRKIPANWTVFTPSIQE